MAETVSLRPRQAGLHGAPRGSIEKRDASGSTSGVSLAGPEPAHLIGLDLATASQGWTGVSARSCAAVVHRQPRLRRATTNSLQ